MRPRLLVDGRIFSLQANGDESLLWSRILGHPSFRARHDVTLAIYPGGRKNPRLADVLKHVQPGFRAVDLGLPPSSDPAFNSPEHAARRLEAVRAVCPSPDLVLNTHVGEVLAGPGRRQILIAPGGRENFLPEAARAAQPGLFAAASRSAAAIVCPSQTVRRALLARTGSEGAPRLPVIYPGHDPAPVARRENTVVFAGPRGAASRFNVVMAAIAMVMPYADWQLAILGGGPEDDAVRMGRETLADALEFLPDLADGRLAGRMATARAYISADEGDWPDLALLQALASGTPAILADTPAHREIAGDRGRYFLPGDAEGAALLLKAIMTSTAPPQPRLVNRPWRDVVAEFLRLIEREATPHAA